MQSDQPMGSGIASKPGHHVYDGIASDQHFRGIGPFDAAVVSMHLTDGVVPRGELRDADPETLFWCWVVEIKTAYTRFYVADWKLSLGPKYRPRIGRSCVALNHDGSCALASSIEFGEH